MSKLGGLGYSGFSVSDDHLFTLGAFGDEEKLLAFNASNGKKIWELNTGELLTNNWGDGPRMTPTVSDGLVYALGGRGNLICAMPKVAKKWSVHLVQELEESSGWVTPSQFLSIRAASSALLAVKTPLALDAKTGKVLWRRKIYRCCSVLISHRNRAPRKTAHVQLVMKNLVGIETKSGKRYGNRWPGK